LIHNINISAISLFFGQIKGMIFGLGSVMSAAPSRPPPRYLPFVRIINNEDWSEPPRHARCNSLLKYKFPAKNENVPKVADLKNTGAEYFIAPGSRVESLKVQPCQGRLV
jgi:hypothetical protein